MASATGTTHHQTIMEWVEARGGHPAHVTRTGQPGDPGVLRIDHPGYTGGQSVEPLDRGAWFDAFKQNQLAFLFQGTTSDGQTTRFSKLVRRRPEDEHPQGTPHRRGIRRKGGTNTVDLNTACEEELEALWGVGPTIAPRILDYRKKAGGIGSPDELSNVDGIDGATMDLIRKQLR